MATAKPHKVLAAGDVAKLLGVSYQYIDKLAQEGKLPFQQTSSGRIFLEEDVMAFKRKRDQKAKRDPRIKLRRRAKQG
ncbi:excisionase family DNA-binding protein [Candidatus Peregrinibacteria bacterium]|nr:excisionase family DNA-binding protein [Candidatus Peregrinibacteria bacterium]